MEITLVISSVLISSLVGGVVPLMRSLAETIIKKAQEKGEITEFHKTISKIFGIEIDSAFSYREKMDKRLEMLKNAFNEVDTAIVEFTTLLKEKEQSIGLLENRLSYLSTEEDRLQKKVSVLQNAPIEIVTHLEEVLHRGDKKSAYRDYILFVSGIIVSVVVTIILKVYFQI